MRLTLARRLATTAANSAKRVKTDEVLVDCKSVVTDFHCQQIRPRLGDKLEFVGWDPLVQRRVLFKEAKKLRTLPVPKPGRTWKWLELHHDPANLQTDKWYRLPNSEGRDDKISTPGHVENVEYKEYMKKKEKDKKKKK